MSYKWLHNLSLADREEIDLNSDPEPINACTSQPARPRAGLHRGVV
jgi:hypothetical protein